MPSITIRTQSEQPKPEVTKEQPAAGEQTAGEKPAEGESTSSSFFGAFGKRHYEGGFDDKMTRREAALILGVRESAAPQRIKVKPCGYLLWGVCHHSE